MLSVLAAAPAQADEDHAYHGHSTAYLGTCLKQISNLKHTHDFVKVEYLSVTHEGDPSFEIEVRDMDGAEWEFMCEANDGSIYEVEQEAESANDARFKKNVKVNEQQARKTVTDLYAGTIEEVEYEIEANGDATYEMDVADAQGTEFKVEVDAASGDIIEVHVEEWEIGGEPDEHGKK
jgi:uncharacterized membrane protein YkoI